MHYSRILAVEHVRLESAPGLAAALRWFYGELAELDELPPDRLEGDDLRFRSERIQVRFQFTPTPDIDPVRVRATILVPSLDAVIEQCQERRIEYTLLTGLMRTDRRIHVLDPAGHRIALKQGWSFAPL